MPKDKEELDLSCLDCGTGLVKDRFEWVCPTDGHRFKVVEGKLVVAERYMAGPGPDGVPDRRKYPSLDGGITRRTVEPKDAKRRAHDPMDEEARDAAVRASRQARQYG